MSLGTTARADRGGYKSLSGMRLAALIQFYLPYVLPRSDDWERRGVVAAISDLQLRWRARGFAEPLFPNEIDQTLSSMTIQLRRVSLPVSAVAVAVRDVALDRVEVVVSGDTLPSEARDAIEDRFLAAAVELTNAILQHCRILARTSFLTGLEEHFRIQDGRRYFLFPRSMTWFDGITQARFPFYGEVNATCSGGAIRSPEQGQVKFEQLENSLAQGPPDLAEVLLLDAEERVVTLRLREALLSLATACEVASNDYLRRHGADSDPVVKRINKSRDSFAIKRFVRVPQHVSRRSLLADDPGTFHDVECLYRARNAVAHRGSLSFDDGGIGRRVDLPLATSFLASARRAVEWIHHL
jgi:hypothetical protein